MCVLNSCMMYILKNNYGHSNYKAIVDNSKFWKGCLLLAIITGLSELGSLLGLTFVTSHNVDYFAFHQVRFVNGIL